MMADEQSQSAITILAKKAGELKLLWAVAAGLGGFALGIGNKAVEIVRAPDDLRVMQERQLVTDEALAQAVNAVKEISGRVGNAERQIIIIMDAGEDVADELRRLGFMVERLDERTRGQ